MTRKQLERSGLKAIRNLRKIKLEKGLPFMINDKNLPSNQCYFEYPDGIVVLSRLSRRDNDFNIITEYSLEEGKEMLARFKFS